MALVIRTVKLFWLYIYNTQCWNLIWTDMYRYIYRHRFELCECERIRQLLMKPLIQIWELRQCSDFILTRSRVNRKFISTRCKVRHWYHSFSLTIRIHIVIYIYTYTCMYIDIDQYLERQRKRGRVREGRTRRTYRSNWKHQITEFGVRGA